MRWHESTLREYCARLSELSSEYGDFDAAEFNDWWVDDRYAPKWDLVATCRLQGKAAVLIVEGKANVHELLHRDAKTPVRPGKAESVSNDDTIRGCLRSAATGLRRSYDARGTFYLGGEPRYQLSNRLAHMWKLAECRLNVVLLYLGFLNDLDAPKGQAFLDDRHWQAAMGACMYGVAPLWMPGARRRAEVAGGRHRGWMLMLSKSLPAPGPPHLTH
ncbi:hypothetical protein JXD38_12600 [candidate division WOR-3 bacterium]|nr:hypothetical protein [candidate division WOR-3 bacterium]